MNNKELTQEYIKYLKSLQHITTGQIPDIDLYMDQVTTFMDTQLSDTRRYKDDKVLTKTMINNYAKNKLFPPPVNKKYNKEQILYLIFIYYLKNYLSIYDIKTMMDLVADIGSSEGAPDFSSLYMDIVEATKNEEIFRLMKDVVHKMDISEKLYEDIPDEKTREKVQAFAYLSLLGFDVYLKKTLMERIIDSLREEPEAEPKKKKK